jgi:hypothetical protein
MRSTLLLTLTLVLGGCVGTVKDAVRAYGSAVISQADTTKVLITRCKSGEVELCDAALHSLEALQASAKTLQNIE